MNQKNAQTKFIQHHADIGFLKNIMIKDAMNDFKMEDFDMIEVDSDSSSSSDED